MHSTGYQILLTTLLSLNFGIVLFDRNALSFLMPFIQPELGLNNTQVGMLAGALSLTWAVAPLGVGAIADRQIRKQLLRSDGWGFPLLVRVGSGFTFG